jgi:hypothetical protein
MKGSDRDRGLTALDLLEEAVHLLRAAPLPVLGWYLIGATPFVLVLLYFWTDMSWSADARRDCAVDALFVGLAFVWMKFCQAMFARGLSAQLKLEAALQMTRRARLRIFLQQSIIQPSKLFVLPFAFILTIPFGWVCAFYENVTAFGEARNLSALWSRAWKQAKLWPRQNHNVLAILLLLCVVMFLNILLLVMWVPSLMKTFSGFENVFTRSGVHVLNSTVLAVIASLTYLCCDPLQKAVYVLRCFYGEALQSGEDLQVELRRMRAKTAAIAAAVVVLFASGVPGYAAQPVRSQPLATTAEELDRSIGETITKPEFSWRMSRDEAGNEAGKKTPNAFDRFLSRAYHAITTWWRDLLDWLDRLLPRPSGPISSSDNSGGIFSRGVLEIALAVLCAVLLIFLAKRVRDRIVQSRQAPVSPPLPRAIDLTQESVTADQLPEDEWLKLALDMIEQREWRLAMRALFLAGLAHLSRQGVIALARHKSNREYQMELRRRVPAQSALQEAFARNLREVERAWYGEHEVDAVLLETFQHNLEIIRAA